MKKQAIQKRKQYLPGSIMLKIPFLLNMQIEIHNAYTYKAIR
jgi:hypothetical protein